MYNLPVKSIDIMKFTKDTVNNQFTTSAKLALLTPLAAAGATHISISVPLDTNAQMVSAGNTPSPLSIENETKEWLG